MASASTIGNSLRRVLLSSLQGAAITARQASMARCTSSPTLPGVVEDVTDIILNLKETLIRVDDDKTFTSASTKRATVTGDRGRHPDRQ